MQQKVHSSWQRTQFASARSSANHSIYWRHRQPSRASIMYKLYMYILYSIIHFPYLAQKVNFVGFFNQYIIKKVNYSLNQWFNYEINHFATKYFICQYVLF